MKAAKTVAINRWEDKVVGWVSALGILTIVVMSIAERLA